MNSYASDSIIRRYLSQGVSVVFKGRLFVDFIHKEALAKVLNNNVAANFSLRVLFYKKCQKTPCLLRLGMNGTRSDVSGSWLSGGNFCLQCQKTAGFSPG
jgi:hypothetical protein